jgi:hypothetical protein
MHRLHPIPGEDAHQVVIEAQVELRLARVALTTTTTAELVVDAAGFVALGADHEQTAEALDLLLLVGAGLAQLGEPGLGLIGPRCPALGRTLHLEQAIGIAAEHDVGATTRHVRRHRDRSLATGLGDDLGLERVALRVQDAVRDALRLEQGREPLRLLDRRGAHQDRTAQAVLIGDLLDDRAVLVVLAEVDEVVDVLADHRPVRRDRDHVEPVDLRELGRLGERRAGHARELLEHAEVVLQGDGRQRLRLLLRRHALLRLDGLVETVTPAPSDHQTTGELIDDDDFDLAAALVLRDDVVLVALVDVVRAQRLLEVVRPIHVGRVRVEAADAGKLFRALDALLGQQTLLLLLLDLEVLAFLELAGDPVRHQVLLGLALRRAGDDQRRAGLVDQDRVDFVDDREVEVLLDLLLRRPLHVVAEVVEAELVVRPVQDVAGVHRLALLRRHARLDRADRQPEILEDGRHPVPVALGQVVVDRDDVDAPSGQRIQRRGQRRDERLALPGGHLRDLAVVQDHAADQL